MAETRRWAGLASRSELKVANNLGIVPKLLNDKGANKFRRKDLDIYDAYYEGRQYAGMTQWKQAMNPDGSYIPVRERAPLLQYNFVKTMCSRLSSKLVGAKNFPKFKVEEDPDTEQYISMVLKSSKLRSNMVEPVRRMCASGSALVRYSIVNGTWKIDHYLAKWCFPEFDDNGNLQSVKIQYIYEDKEDLDERKLPKKKWFKMELGPQRDVLYNNPEVSDVGIEEPVFEVAKVADHNLGFVQAEWLRTAKQPNSIDGPSLVSDILGFVDELNYSLSQSAQSISYNQDPQLIVKGMDEEELSSLIRSATKAWNVGRDGEASFLEAGMNGTEAAGEFREMVKQKIQDVARVIMLDPEKTVGHAQSGRAMEVLHGPMVDLIEELKPALEQSIQNLVLKMALTNLIVAERGGIAPINVPPGYKPKSLNLTIMWPDVFPKTMQDLRDKVSVAVQAASGNLISRKSMTKWLAKDFDIEDIEAELEEIATQPIINPFGAF
jgi:hypothetical protein